MSLPGWCRSATVKNAKRMTQMVMRTTDTLKTANVNSCYCLTMVDVASDREATVLTFADCKS